MTIVKFFFRNLVQLYLDSNLLQQNFAKIIYALTRELNMISTVLKGDCRCEKDELILAMYEKVESNLKSIIDVLKKLKLDSKINEDLFIKLKNAKIDLDSVSKELDIFLKGIKLHLLILKGSKDSKEI